MTEINSRRISLRILLTLLLLSLTAQASGQLVHPGISHKRSDLERMKYMVESGVEPWASTFAALSSHTRAQHDYVLNVVNQDPSYVIEYSPQSRNWFINDGTAAYYNALMWYITGDARHAEKAIEVFNTYKGLRRNTTGIPLNSGRVWRVIEAAEIIAHTYDGWDPVEQQEFKDMLVYPGYSATTVPTQAIQNNDFTFYWHIYNGDPARHGNQGLFAMRTMMAMGIFLDNEVMYERALRYLRGETHRSDDLPYPPGPSINNNEITQCAYFDEFTLDGFSNAIPDYGFNEVVGNYIFENGQSQESSRDQAHALAGVITINVMSEMAWNQGDDLYGHLGNRPLLGLEFYLRYNLSYHVPFPDQPQPWEPTVASGEYIERTDRSGRWRSRMINPGVNCDPTNLTRGENNLQPIYEMCLGHYRDRIGLPSDDYLWLQRGQDNFLALVEIEKEGVVTDHPVYGSLTFRRVSPGDPIIGFDDQGSPEFEVNQLPGTVEAENYDHFVTDGEGRTYHDASPGNSGGEYRNDGVDIQTASIGGYAVTDLEFGEWLDYTCYVPETDVYHLNLNYASDGEGAEFVLVIDEVNVEISLPSTGGLSSWDTYHLPNTIPLSKGMHVFRFYVAGSSHSFNLNSFTVAPLFPGLPGLVVEGASSATPPVVSSNDLAQTAFFNSEGVSNDELASESSQLFNGQIGDTDSNTSDSGEVRLHEGDSLTIHFDILSGPMGYDISRINSIFGWNPASGGRSNQGYSVEFVFVDDTTLQVDAQHWAPNDPAEYWTTATFFDAAGGSFISGVKSITFSISEEANARGVLVAREFDIFGTPTGSTGGPVEPTEFQVTAGNLLDSAGLQGLIVSDNQDLSVTRNANDITSRAWLEVSGISPLATPSSLSFTLEASVFARKNVNQTIELWDYDTATWEQIDFKAASRFVDQTTTVDLTSGDLTRFVEQGTNRIEARVRFQSPDPRQRFTANIDFINWYIE